jgi:Ubiquitin-conjugating enzyme
MAQLDHQGFAAYYESVARQLDPLEQRLAREHMLVEALCDSHASISYKLIHPDQLPPRDYRITFYPLSTIVAVDADMLPIFADKHMMEIHLPASYPAEAPICYMVSEVWHPNIQSEEGLYQGRICGNTEGFGTHFSLDDLILRIESMLKYEIYHAELRFPYPEDENVARWVREYAEPLGIVKPGLGLIANGAMPDDWRIHVKPEQKIRISMHGGDNA